MEVGDIVILKGKSRKGSMRVKSDGEKWKVERMSDSQMLLVSLTPSKDKGIGNDWRWVNLHNDPNFTFTLALDNKPPIW